MLQHGGVATVLHHEGVLEIPQHLCYSHPAWLQIGVKAAFTPFFIGPINQSFIHFNKGL